MKNLALSILLFAFTTAGAQKKAPYEMNLAGVKVIVYPSGNEIVEIQTIIKGGVQNYAPAKAGIENLAFKALTECGTLNDNKNAFLNKLDAVSAQIGGWAGRDFAGVSMNCIMGDLETVWPLYVDALTIPKFDSKEFARIKNDMVTSIKADESNPDNALFTLARQTAFSGKTASVNPKGSIKTLTPLTAAETKAYYNSIFNKGRMFIVVVADIERAALEPMLTQLLSKVRAGKAFEPKKETFKPVAHSFKAEQKDNATNYVAGLMSAPLPGTPDYTAYSLAMSIFYNKHFVEIRSKKGLSYAPGVYNMSGLTPFSALYVTTTEPNKYIAAARALIDTIKMKGFTAEELKGTKAYSVSSMYYNQETNSALAASLVSNEVLHANWRKAITAKEDISNITVDDLNRVFKQYINNIMWVYQGDPKKADPKMFTQKETPKPPVEKKTF